MNISIAILWQHSPGSGTIAITHGRLCHAEIDRRLPCPWKTAGFQCDTSGPVRLELTIDADSLSGRCRIDSGDGPHTGKSLHVFPA